MTPQRQPAAPHVLIVMCTLNGARWLPEQLDSIAAQTHGDWSLWVSDDGSTDDTLAVLRAFRDRRDGLNEVRILTGPGQGPAQNYLSVILHPNLPTGPGTYLALADQDDVWLPGKLLRGIARMTRLEDPARPAIYGAQSIHIDADGKRIGRSRRPRRPLALGNAVVQNMVSGHSLILNPAAVALARQAGRHPGIRFHDWWLSLLIIAAGGVVLIDEAEVLLYRQHGRNAIGAPQGAAAHLRRLRMMIGRDYSGWIEAKLSALRSGGVALTPDAQALLRALESGARPGLARMRLLRSLGIHRQSGFGTLCLYLAGALGRV